MTQQGHNPRGLLPEDRLNVTDSEIIGVIQDVMHVRINRLRVRNGKRSTAKVCLARAIYAYYAAEAGYSVGQICGVIGWKLEESARRAILRYVEFDFCPTNKKFNKYAPLVSRAIRAKIAASEAQEARREP